MPIYEYICEPCKKLYEELQRVNTPPAPCPSCGQPGKRQVSSTSFALKGSGWYATEYGNRSTGKSD